MSFSSSSDTGGSNNVPTIRQLFETIADEKLSRTLLAGLSYLVDELNISVPLKLSSSLVPILETLDHTGKITADTLKVPILEYLYITVIQLFITYNYDIKNKVSKDHNLTTEQFVKQFSADINKYTDICCVTYCNYIKENANKGLTDNLNKEFATRVLVEHMFLTLILQPAFNPQVISLPPSLCGALFLLGIDFVQDKVNSNALPHLKYEEIVPFYFKYFDSHFKPIIINYFEKKSKSLLGIELPVTPLNLPPTNDPLLVAVLNGSSKDPSPSELFSGIYMIPVWNQFIGGLQLTPDFVIIKP
jgi:hypothetical protein